MPISLYESKLALFNKVNQSRKAIGDTNEFLAPVESILNRTDLDDNTKASLIEDYFNKNFSKFAGIEEVRKFYKIQPKFYGPIK